MTTFSGSDEERAKEYIYLLQDAGLSTEMTDALLEGFSISNRVDEKLTEQHKLTNPVGAIFHNINTDFQLSSCSNRDFFLIRYPLK